MYSHLHWSCQPTLGFTYKWYYSIFQFSDLSPPPCNPSYVCLENYQIFLKFIKWEKFSCWLWSIYDFPPRFLFLPLALNEIQICTRADWRVGIFRCLYQQFLCHRQKCLLNLCNARKIFGNKSHCLTLQNNVGYIKEHWSLEGKAFWDFSKS